MPIFALLLAEISVKGRGMLKNASICDNIAKIVKYFKWGAKSVFSGQG
jgi:hypothetical protein